MHRYPSTSQAKRPEPGRPDGAAPGRPPDLHGAAVVDEHGVEVPMTDRIVREALDDLHAAWLRERRRRNDGRG